MNKIEEALASETTQNEKLKKQLAELKDSQKRLEEQTEVFEKKKAELAVLRDESHRKQEEI
jgi:small-conductance mechanosensitive channel